MTPPLRYTLVADGTSDRALMPLLRWTLLQTGTQLPLAGTWADPGQFIGRPPGLASRLRRALDLYPCDLLFVHRDAENQDPELRHGEFQAALDDLKTPPPAICVVPVRMTETWLLTDASAIRRSADNPHGGTSLSLPSLRQLESLPDPKHTLNELLRAASEKQGRRLLQFKRDEAARRLRVAELTEDFSPLMNLPAFQRFHDDTHRLLQEHGWLEEKLR